MVQRSLARAAVDDKHHLDSHVKQVETSLLHAYMAFDTKYYSSLHCIRTSRKLRAGRTRNQSSYWCGVAFFMFTGKATRTVGRYQVLCRPNVCYNFRSYHRESSFLEPCPC